MKISATILLAGLVVLLVSGPPASAADKEILQLQLDVSKLQRTVQELQTSVDAKNTSLVQQMGKMADQMNNLTANMQKLSELIGTIKSDNAAATAAAAANAAKSANDTRDALSPLTAAVSELRKSVDALKEGQTANGAQLRSLNDQLISMKATSEALPTCKDFKQQGDANRNSKYDADAISDYREFMAKCAMDSRAAEVQLSIAEALYDLGKFDQAVLDYDIFLRNYPTSDKTASALLRKGLAHAKLNQPVEARAAFTRITTEFKTATSEFASATAELKKIPAPAAAGRGGRGNQ